MPSRREVWQSSFPEAKQIATGAVRVRGCGHFRGYRQGDDLLGGDRPARFFALHPVGNAAGPLQAPVLDWHNDCVGFDSSPVTRLLPKLEA